MTAEETAAIAKAYAALFAIDLLLAKTYSPDRAVLEALHDRIYSARAGLETTFKLED